MYVRIRYHIDLFFSPCRMGATCFVQPLDLVKNRMQVATSKEHKTSYHVIRHVIKSEGFTALYSGLSAGLLRQATYTTTRLGIYTWLFEKASGLVVSFLSFILPSKDFRFYYLFTCVCIVCIYRSIYYIML